MSLLLARLPRTASSTQRSRHLCSTRAAAPVLLAHVEVTKIILKNSMGPKLRYPPVHVVQARDPLLTRARIVSTIIPSILMGLIFYNLTDDQRGVQGKMGGE